MKKPVLIIMTIAILGALGLFVDKKPAAPGSLNGFTSQTSAQSPVSSSAGASAGSSPGNTGGNYKDGTFTGAAVDTPYGTVQIALVVSGGKITNVDFLQMPSDQRHSQEITAYAEPTLKQNTLSAQNANIDFVSGATVTSEGYEQSLQKALDQAA